MDKKYEVVRNEVIFSSRNKLDFEYPIFEAVEFEDYVIVLISPENRKIIYNENVFGISKDKERVVWQVEKRKTPKDNCPFVGITVEERKVFVTDVLGYAFEIDIKNGKILGWEFVG